MAIKRDLLKDKLLDTRSFNTVFISLADEEKMRHEQMDILVELLCNDKYKGSQMEVFNFLKKEKKAVELLMRAIKESKGDKKKLVAVCWEAGIDCGEYISLFTDIVLKDDYATALEAITVIGNIDVAIPAQQIDTLIPKVKESYSADSPKAALLMELVEVLRRWQA